MDRVRICASNFLCRALAAAPLLFGFGLAACVPEGMVVAEREPGVCGGDFGVLEQMQYEYRGNAKPVSDEAFDAC